MRSFVLGNGTSRLNIKPEELKRYGTMYGCNALYREFEPDFLIAVDPKMIVEIEKTGYQRTHEVWTNPNAKYRNFQGFKYFTPSLGWSSGPTALNMAAQHGAKEIWIIGFDYVGLNGYLNNVYADSNNYRKSTDTATYYGNWKRQTEQVIRNYPKTRFYRATTPGFFNPEWDYPNFRHVTFEEMKKLIPTWPEKPSK